MRNSVLRVYVSIYNYNNDSAQVFIRSAAGFGWDYQVGLALYRYERLDYTEIMKINNGFAPSC
jgi:hypothetical protein